MKRKMILTVLTIGMTVGMIPIYSCGGTGSNPFTDVDDSNWFYKDVQYAYEQGYMSGTAPNRFSPEEKTERRMLVTVLHRMEGAPNVEYKGQYEDVETGKYYTVPVAWGTDKNIVTGLSDSVFSPDCALTREEMITMLYRYADYKGYDISAVADLGGYNDAGSVSPYAKNAMSWALAEGILSGTPDQLLNPKGEASRAQLAAVLRRFNEKYTENGEPGTKIDMASLGELAEKGKVYISFRKNGNIGAIDGKFTDQKVNSEEDAAKVLMSAKSLFGQKLTVSAEDISLQKIELPPKEYFFRYSPRVNGIPVSDGTIIIATDGEGNVTGLTSYYDKSIENVDTVPSVTEKDAASIAVADFVQIEEIAEVLDYIEASGKNRKDIEATLKDSLECETKLIINTADEQLPTALMYVVTITSEPGYLGSVKSMSIAECMPELVDNEKKKQGYIPLVRYEYYIYANGDKAGQIGFRYNVPLVIY